MKHKLAGVLLAIGLLPAMSAAVDECPDTGRLTSDPAVVEQLKKLEFDRIQAGVRKDIGYIDAATADEYVQIDWAGKTRTAAG